MWERETDLNDSIFGLLVTLTLIAGFVVLVLMVSAVPVQFSSAVFVKPGSYSNYVHENATVFVYGVENKDVSDKEYLVEFYAGNQLLKQDRVSVKRGETREKRELLSFPPQKPAYPFTLSVVLVDGETRKTAFFWVKGEQ